MGDVSASNEVDKGEAVPDGRNLSLQQLLDLWLSYSPRIRRSVLRGLWYQEGRFARNAKENPRPRQREFAAEMQEPTRAARWLLRGISKAMDPSYDLRADGTPNADEYKVHHRDEPTPAGRP